MQYLELKRPVPRASRNENVSFHDWYEMYTNMLRMKFMKQGSKVQAGQIKDASFVDQHVDLLKGVTFLNLLTA